MIFSKAKKIFLKDQKEEANIFAGFANSFQLEKLEKTVVNICARSFYRLFINGEFVMHGPSIAAHNCGRADTVDITDHLAVGNNIIAVEIASYNTPSLYITGEYGYLIAEVVANNTVLAFSDKTWAGYLLKHRSEKVERFSHARVINELYHLSEKYDAWKNQEAGNELCTSNVVEEIDDNILFTLRNAPLPDIKLANQPVIAAFHDIKINEQLKAPLFTHIENPAYLEDIKVKGWERPSVEAYQFEEEPFSGRFSEDGNLEIDSNVDGVAIEYDFKKLCSAFPGIDIEFNEDAIIDIVHGDKYDINGYLAPRATASNVVIRLHAKAGKICFEGFEPYSIRYIKLIIRTSGKVKINKVYLRKYQFGLERKSTFLCSDGELNRIFEAADNTLRVSTADVFRDCPGRERAAFLCDSLWSARTAYMLYNDTTTNKDMLENFLYEPIPLEGDYFPTCYPAYYLGAGAIPNWALFLILQLLDYYKFTGDAVFVEKFKVKILGILENFAKYENEFGLLDSLKGWIFIDWSSANDAENTQPISVATNCLYAVALKACAEMYEIESLKTKAENILEILSMKAYSNEFFSGSGRMFSDSMKVENGELVSNKYISEAAQYYCILAGLDINKQKDLISHLFDEFGPDPVCSKLNPSVATANVFIADILRFEALSKFNMKTKISSELKKLFGSMLDNGYDTFWETNNDFNSVCHSFTSYAAVIILRDVLGVGLPNAASLKVTINPSTDLVNWAKGSVLTSKGYITVDFSMNSECLQINASVPNGYEAKFVLPIALRIYDNVKIIKDGESMEYLQSLKVLNFGNTLSIYADNDEKLE